MKIITNLLKERKDEWLVQTISDINDVNPMVDRIMEDDSVEIVIMANHEAYGIPIMKIITNLLKERKDEWLVQTTSDINDVNPMVDRIMEDDSVEIVIMANHEGLPILTNGNALGATHYATAIHRLGTMIQAFIKDMDPFDETLVFRLKTVKREMLTAPHKEFSIIVVQHGRPKKVKKSTKKTKRSPAFIQDC